jgi:hypothetical protein
VQHRTRRRTAVQPPAQRAGIGRAFQAHGIAIRFDHGKPLGVTGGVAHIEELPRTRSRQTRRCADLHPQRLKRQRRQRQQCGGDEVRRQGRNSARLHDEITPRTRLAKQYLAARDLGGRDSGRRAGGIRDPSREQSRLARSAAPGAAAVRNGDAGRERGGQHVLAGRHQDQVPARLDADVERRFLRSVQDAASFLRPMIFMIRPPSAMRPMKMNFLKASRKTPSFANKPSLAAAAPATSAPRP